ncbi:MAG TPA: glycosyltransferase family 2 protein [Anaerolineae bacterium]|nr:glycosyltransferase family 2 protein [Anaerolineae bacterium]
MTKLSIIIPCYNCESTLAEAVGSVRAQTSYIPFDLTMVDDGSTDGTYGLMEALASGYPGTKLVRHASNRGGGAARNTAVENSDGDLIFCLDSDDMLGADFLKNLTAYWVEKRCDGLGISTSIKFNRRNIHNVEYVSEFTGPGERVRFESLFDGSSCSLMSTFLMTRPAFAKAGGYPTAHGFDTQGMAFRFLCNGLQAYTCPDTVYFHRVNYHESYYAREDRAGHLQWNWIQVLLEFLYLFCPDIQAYILGSNPFPDPQVPMLDEYLRRQQSLAPIYAADYGELVRLGRDGVAERKSRSADNMYDLYWLGEYYLSKGKFSEALDSFASATKSGLDCWILHCRMMEAAVRLSGSAQPIALSLQGVQYFVNHPRLTVKSLAPPLPPYQRFENWLFRHPRLVPLGRALKAARISLRGPRLARTG